MAGELSFTLLRAAWTRALGGPGFRRRSCCFGIVAALGVVSCNAILNIEDKSLRGPSEGDGGPGDGARSGYREVVAADAPISYLRLGEPSGASTAHNEIAVSPPRDGVYPNAGVELGVPGALFGDSDTAIRLAGSRFVRMPEWDGVRFEANHAFSMEAWVRPGTPVDYGFLIDHENHDDPRGKSGWALIVGRNEVSLERTESGVNLGTVASQKPLTSDEWHHVVATYDGTGEALFIDGARAGDAVSDQPIVSRLADGWAIGGENCACTVTNFIGDLDEVAIYDYALPEGRIKAHFAAATR